MIYWQILFNGSIPLEVQTIKKEQFFIKNLLFLLLCLSPWVSIASSSEKQGSNDDYQIELIIFANNENYNAAEEHWSSEITLVYPDNLVALPTSEVEKNEYGMQLASFNRLAGALANIERNHRYRVLFANAWIQPLKYKAITPYISISGGQSIDNIDELAGAIQLYRARYIHIKTQLWYVDFIDGISYITPIESELIDMKTHSWLWPIPPFNPLLQQGSPFSENYNNSLQNTLVFESNLLQTLTADIKRIGIMEESRRLKSRQAHYLDHPLFGVLVQVYKHKKEE